ncbi:hypothetical protein A1F94_005306 [Pyrenophora tritici-repentis]|uniref:Uncharacterized protein n=1 Tax=Pyrenophora tritici-repentis TaxID=45151 RepID=A0A317AU52_9PLEO|nr:hypothetical protein PtrM4_102030 [Pyrenophora tritici-repentis]KAG9383395.1 hypothetical protein A1F94_005306 [Pyrenophora tritici-repentis]PWO21167.1 hypothetical protein PtrARCrB10_10322 [Pyrenophora tritici-repentis]
MIHDFPPRRCEFQLVALQTFAYGARAVTIKGADEYGMYDTTTKRIERLFD